jgi:NAD(P)-dependent dehydrogenase (short-subunit alcohol dehydrogenase family)
MRVNVEGTANVNRHFFPRMRAPGVSGSAPPLIVVTGSELSLAGVSNAFNGPYSMSKFAIEAYAAALRQELSLLPGRAVAVTVLNPGAVDTPLVSNQLAGGSNAFFERHAADYAQLLETRPEGVHGTRWRSALSVGAKWAQAYMQYHAVPASQVAARIVRLVHTTRPPPRLAPNMSFEMRAASFVPQWVLDYAVKQQFGIDSISTAQ